MGGVFGQVLGLTVIFTPWLLLAIFLIVLVAEFGISIPYLMETVWLFSGYNLAVGNITVGHLILFCMVGIIGRIAGSSALFYISWYSKSSFGMLFVEYFKPRLIRIVNSIRPLRTIFNALSLVVCWVASRTSQPSLCGANDSKALSVLGWKFNLSPFTVALGRFLCLRMPITIALGAKKQRTSLLLGVMIFSVVWDGAYIAFGVWGGEIGLEPTHVILYPLGIMVFISALVFGFQRLRNSLHRVKLSQPSTFR